MMCDGDSFVSMSIPVGGVSASGVCNSSVVSVEASFLLES